MSTRLLVDILGWIGSFEVIIAYGLISSKRVDGQSVMYQLLNLTGAILLIVNTVYLEAYPSAFINIVWVGIAIAALWKSWRGSTVHP
ncbi:MAG: hypothetical protein AAGA85_15835 [Bacteroidota bacterium]